MRNAIIRISLLSLVSCTLASGQDEAARLLKKALGDDKIAGNWIYEDIEAGYARARKTGKPLLVSFR